jgi:phosphoglycerol transferase
LPILLLFALKRLSKTRQEREIGITLAALCALVAFWDQTPPVATEAKIAEVAQVVQSDREFAQKLEARLPKGAMIFQIPIMEFPESPAAGVSGYDHFRLYLHSKDLRFSFGGIKGRPWLQWQKDIAQKSLPDFIQTLESYGFAAVYVNRNGFQDKGEGVLKAIRNLGYTDVMESGLGDLFCVVIHPSQHPILPAGAVQ